MHANKMNRLGGFWLLVAVLGTTSLEAAGDRRLADAAKQQDGQAVRALLAQGAGVDTPQLDGATALHWAAHWDDLETADLLLRAGANVNVANRLGVTPLALACENGSAVMVERLLTAGANANASQASGETALMTAARSGNLKVVNVLLGHGANVNAATGELGQTALMWAVSEHHLDIVRMLVEHGADVGAWSKRGLTALMFAAQIGDVEAARILLAAGAAVNQAALDRSQALPLAVATGHARFALFLLDNGADANATTQGVAALHAAAGTGTYLGGRGASLQTSERFELVKTLLTHGADPNVRTLMVGRTDGESPRKGARDPLGLGVGTGRGATPFWLAASSADVDLMRVLLERGADPRLTPECQSTPLMVAAGLGQSAFTFINDRTRMLAAVKFLVEVVGADVNAINEGGFTALHGAAYTGSDVTAQYLVDHGARTNVQDWKGRTPFRIAQGHKAVTDFFEWPRTAELLRKLGADTSLGVDGRIAEREPGRAREAGKP